MRRRRSFGWRTVTGGPTSVFSSTAFTPQDGRGGSGGTAKRLQIALFAGGGFACFTEGGFGSGRRLRYGAGARTTSDIFKCAANVGAATIAIPAVSCGKRGFPIALGAAIAASVAASEILASGSTLKVYLIGYGDEDLTDSFQQALEMAQSCMVPLRPVFELGDEYHERIHLRASV